MKIQFKFVKNIYNKKNLELLKSFLDEKTKKNPLHVDHPSRVWTICLARSSEIDFINRYKNMDFKIFIGYKLKSKSSVI